MDFSASVYRFFFPSILVRMNTDKVYLTFDDGPHPLATPVVLDILKDRKIKATFFLIGENVRRHPELARRIGEDGHSIGNHCQHHVALLTKSRSAILDEIESANRTIQETTGKKPQLFRPPYGYYDYRAVDAARSQGMRLVHWSIDTRDFVMNGRSARIESVIKKTMQGSILLLHDNERTATSAATLIPRLIDGITTAGHAFAPLP